MTITNRDEYQLRSGQYVSIQFSVEGGCWEVGCWNKDDTAHWYKEFNNEIEARREFEKWKPQ